MVARGRPQLPHMNYKEFKTNKIGVGFSQGRRYWRVQTEVMSLQKARIVRVGGRDQGTRAHLQNTEQWTGVGSHTLFLYGARE